MEIQNQNFVEIYNGFVTVENPATGNHRTFRIKSEVWNEEQENETTKRVVALLTGPDRDDWRAWVKFGDVRSGRVSVWPKYRGTAFEKLAKILDFPNRGEASGLVYLFEGCCRRCNRKLTTPESIRLGLGPICAEKDLT